MIRIWIRRTVDWEDEERAVSALTDPWLLPKIPVWDATFTMSYASFRRRVSEIARLNHSRVAGASPAAWEEIEDGDVVMPVDDDDWFAPDAGEVLGAQLDPGATGYLWQSRWVQVPFDVRHRLYLARRALFPRTPPKWICSTNNYAMVKGAGTREPLSSHIRASRWFAERLGRADGSVKEVEGAIGVANRTLGSQTTLSQRRMTISARQLAMKLRAHRRLYQRPVAEEIAWCRPYVAMMAELMEEIQVRSP